MIPVISSDLRTCSRHATLYGVARSLIKGLVPFAVATLLAACTNPGVKAIGADVPLKSAPNVTGSPTPGVRVYRSPDVVGYERSATGYMIPPATVYRGQGSFFPLSPQQVDEIAAELTKDVRAEIGRHFKVVNAPGPGILTLDLILVTAVPPQVAADYGNEFEAIMALPGQEGGAANGAMTVSGKFTDSTTGKLLVAFLAPVSPQDMDPSAPGRAPDFAQVASEQFATDLVKAIIRQRQNAHAMPK